MTEPLPVTATPKVDLPPGVIGIARKKGHTAISLIINTEDGQVHADMDHASVAHLIAGLAKSMTETIDDVSAQLVEWIGVG